MRRRPRVLPPRQPPVFPPAPVVDLLAGVPQIDAFIDDLVTSFGGGQSGQGVSSDVKGGAHFFVVNASTRLTHQGIGDRRLRGVSIDGTNVLVVTSGLTFNQVNAATAMGDASVICIRGNSSNDKTGWFGPFNIELPFVSDPNFRIYIDNAGAGVARVTLYWDYL